MAEARAETRLWEMARHDPRLMSELTLARTRAEQEEPATTFDSALAPLGLPVATAAVAAPAPVVAPEPEQPPPPTMADVAQLTPEADFSRFVARGVSPEVRNAAVKKLFADPHFNVMDGLDIYIDDYSKPSPLSQAEIAMMVGARFLKLVDDPDEPKKTDAAVPESGATASAPQGEPIPDSGPTAANPGEPETAALPPPHDDHADLQLQPDHAPERDSAGRGAG